MPALKDKAISLLGSARVNATAGAIFTVPPGKSVIIESIWIGNPAASIAAATGINFGVYFNNAAATNCSGITATGLGQWFQSTAVQSWAPAGTSINIGAGTGAAVAADFRIYGSTYTP